MGVFVGVTLEAVECCNCGMVFGMTDETNAKFRNNHEWFYCPRGHRQHYTAKSEAERLRDDLAREKHRHEQAAADAAWQAEQRQAVERRLTATRGVVTRIKNRVGKGVCPCCNRTFKQLAAHMASRHPDYASEVTP